VTEIIIFPAIDLKNGQAVRLKQGKMDEVTVYSDDPVAVAQDFLAQGATHLHVVDLNGAVTGELVNRTVLEELVRITSLKIQVGGGIRTIERMEMLLNLGVDRVILGTAAVRDPELVGQAVARFGSERVVVGIDAKDGRVAVAGWVETSDVSAEELGVRMREKGVTHVIYTDIQRDGMLTGADIAGSAELAGQTGLRVIVSGGIASLEELAAIRDFERRGAGLEGVILGKALYSGAFTLREALQFGI
jgi:phosphoribosylformimino-5-aminoimidazole carboxamide ribotide isomerase